MPVCPHCNSSRYRRRYRRHRYHNFRCRACNKTFARPVPSEVTVPEGVSERYDPPQHGPRHQGRSQPSNRRNSSPRSPARRRRQPAMLVWNNRFKVLWLVCAFAFPVFFVLAIIFGVYSYQNPGSTLAAALLGVVAGGALLAFIGAAAGKLAVRILGRDTVRIYQD